MRTSGDTRLTQHERLAMRGEGVLQLARNHRPPSDCVGWIPVAELFVCTEECSAPSGLGEQRDFIKINICYMCSSIPTTVTFLISSHLKLHRVAALQMGQAGLVPGLKLCDPQPVFWPTVRFVFCSHTECASG